MNNIKKLIFCLLITFIICHPANVIAKTKTFTFMKKHKLTIDIPDTFESSVQKDKDVDLDSKKKPKKVAACILNHVLETDNPELQELFVEEHKKRMIKTYKVTDTEEGVDEILGHNVPYLIFPDPKLPVTHKILYLINTNKVFLMTITFESDAPFSDVEELIENVVEAVNKEDDQ